MSFGLFYRKPMFEDITLGTDRYSGTDGSLNFFTVHHLLAEGPVLLHHLGFGIGKQYKRQLVFVRESVVRIDAVFTHTEHDDIGFFQRRVLIAKSARLLGAGVSSFG